MIVSKREMLSDIIKTLKGMGYVTRGLKKGISDLFPRFNPTLFGIWAHRSSSLVPALTKRGIILKTRNQHLWEMSQKRKRKKTATKSRPDLAFQQPIVHCDRRMWQCDVDGCSCWNEMINNRCASCGEYRR